MKIKYLVATLISLLLLSMSVFAQRLNYDSSFTPTINGNVRFVKILSDQKILIAGDFTTVNGVERNKIARLNPNGSLDSSFDANWMAGPNQNVTILAMKVLSDGKILIGGGLPANGSSGVLRVRRLNADGTADGTLTSLPYLQSVGFEFQTIYQVDQLPNGKILLCGKFPLPNNNPKPSLARYNNDGTYDSTFTTDINSDCNDIAVQPDGKYFVAGYYTTVNGISHDGLTRFNSNDTIDTTFNAALTFYRRIKLESDGSLEVFHGQLVSRVNADGNTLATYPTAISEGGDAAFQSNGKIIVVGEFDQPFGQSTTFNRFNIDSTHDPSSGRISFYTTTLPQSVAIAADGKVIVGGNFTAISFNSGAGISRPYLARLVPEAIPIKPKFDFDGDGKDDIAVYRPSDTVWYLNRSTAGFFSAQFGLSADKPIVADYDGDGKAEIAVFRNGAWYWLRSSDSVFDYRICGQAGDIPQPRYDGNGTAGFLVFRPSDAKFYVQGVFQNETPADMRDLQLLPTDKPVVADYDGDGRDDLAVFRDGHWFVLTSNNLQVRHYQFGVAGDKPVPADYDGDGRTDYAVFRPSNGVWYVNKSTEGFYAAQWGLADDLPVPADYDGDGKTDIAVYRNGVWYQLRSSNSYHIEEFGLSNDIPAQLR